MLIDIPTISQIGLETTGKQTKKSRISQVRKRKREKVTNIQKMKFKKKL